MKQLIIPSGYNYIALFLTLACTMRCSYCITRHGTLLVDPVQLSGAEWVKAINRIVPRSDLPVTIQGGEPTLHPDFYYIINNLRADLNIDLLTNLDFDIARFMREVPPERLKRSAPYASVRVSYHPETMNLEQLAAKILILQNSGYSVGVWGILHPGQERKIEAAKAFCEPRGIDFRTKEFLGMVDGKLHGTYRYPNGCSNTQLGTVMCRTNELIVGPTGSVYRCHGDLYEGRMPIGHILDPSYVINPGFRRCDSFGLCNPCDVKLKTDRFQNFGHTSVDIIPG